MTLAVRIARVWRRWLVMLIIAAATGLATFEVLPERRVARPATSPIISLSEGWQILELTDLRVVYADGATLYAFDDHHLFVSTDSGQTFSRRGSLPKASAGYLDLVKDKVARSRLVRTFRKNRGPGNLVVLESGTILVFFDHIYRSDDGGITFTPVLSLSDGIAAPYFPSGIAVGPDNEVYFGEYSAAPRPREVRIFRGTNDGTQWEIAHTFPLGQIFHLHGIQYDAYRNRFWILAGDRDEESRVLFTENRFATLNTLGSGAQVWRVISVLPAEDRLIWGTDDDRNGATIQSWDFAKGQLEELQFIGSPAYYAVQLMNGSRFITTAFEPDSVYTNTVQPAPETTLWFSSDGYDWEMVGRARAAARVVGGWSPRGKLGIPGGTRHDQLILIPDSTVPDRHVSYLITQPTGR